MVATVPVAISSQVVAAAPVAMGLVSGLCAARQHQQNAGTPSIVSPTQPPELVMPAATSISVRPFARSGRGVSAILVGIVIACGIALRFAHLGAAFDHFDEVFPVALISRAHATGDLDMNVRDADVPAISRYNQYAGSAYHYALLAWDTMLRPFSSHPHEAKPPILRLRVFSALAASLALMLFALVAWRLIPPAGAFIAVTLAALNPTLVQDAHYARPDAFIVLLAVAFCALIGHARPPGIRRAIGAGLVLGILIAAKNTMGLYAALPFLWLGERGQRPHAVRAIAACLGTGLVAFAITEPGAWRHYADFIDGVHRLQIQYSHAFPVSGSIDGTSTYGMTAAYFVATLGSATLALALLGIGVAMMQRRWVLVAVWAAPAIVFCAYFGSKTIFFERAYSPVLPGVFLLVGLSAGEISRRIGPIWAGAAALLLVTAAPGVLVTARFVGDALSDDFAAYRVNYERTLTTAFPAAPLVTTPMWAPVHIGQVSDRWHANGKPIIVRVSDYGDTWTDRTLMQFITQLPAHEFAAIRGPFAELPISTLQVYHVPTWRYFWVGRMPDQALPTPTQHPPSVLLAFFGWLAHPPVYYTVAVALGALLLVLAFAALFDGNTGRTPAFASGWLFPLCLVAALFAFRWPAFFHTPELNVDEAHTIAGGITLSHHPIYWKSVDGTTHGPINDAVLVLPRLFGWPINFLTARVVGCLLIAGALIWIWAGARALWNEALARLAVLPLWAFFALSTFWDFVHYTSEHVDIFLLSMAWGATAVAQGPARPTGWRSTGLWLLAGLSLGVIPYAKMQGTPVAAVIFVWAAVAAWRLSRRDAALRQRPLLALCAASLAPTVACAVFLTIYHLWRHFWQSYILNNLRYATQTKEYSVWQLVSALPSWSKQTEGIIPFALGLAGFLLFALGFARRFARRHWAHVGYAVALTAVSLYAAVAPGRMFHHYLLFVVIPFAGVGGAMLAGAFPNSVRARFALAIVFVGATVGPQVAARVQRPHPFLGDVSNYSNASQVSQIVLRFARPGEPLGIWGYMPRFYVQTGLPQASREGHNERQMLPQPQFEYYRGRYLFDLRRNHPPVFLDAVGQSGFWPTDREHFAHETWPELNAWVRQNYSQVADVEGVRIYVRKDRLPPTD